MPVLFAKYRSAAPIAALAVFVALLTGCNETSVTNAILPQSDRLRLTNDFITEAVDDFNKGRQAEGDAALNRAVVLMTPAPEEYSDTGFIAVAKLVGARGRPQDAVRLLQPLTKDSKDPLLWATLADVAKQSGNSPLFDSATNKAKEQAETVMKTVGTKEPKQSEALTRAESFLQVGEYFDEYTKDYPRAIQAYREAYRLVPSDPRMANALGYVLANRGTTPAEFDEAVTLTRGAFEKEPDEPAILDSFGWALFKRNDAKQQDIDGAQRRLREAVDIAPSVAEIHYHLAVIYEASNLLPDALIEAQRAVTLQGDYPEAKAISDRLQPIVAAMPSPTPSPSPMDTVDASPSPAPTASPAQK